MSEPTQKQKQLAERICSDLLEHSSSSAIHKRFVESVAQLLADAQAKEREVLLKLAEKLQQANPNTTPFTDIHYIANQLAELLK